MFVIIGTLIVIGAIIGGYLMEHGELMVLVQPAELVIIGGAALGTLFIANPLPIIICVFKGILAALAGNPYDKKFYLDSLKMLNDLFMTARKNGMGRLEADVEDPGKSAVLGKYPKFLKNHHAVHFVCDTLRMAISGGVPAFDLDQMMEADMEVHHHESSLPIAALSTVADALPGLGIVAAVLGVVITMGALGGPPEEIGHKVAAALVGTFLGILMSYGMIGPVAGAMDGLGHAEVALRRTIVSAIVGFAGGGSPRAVMDNVRRGCGTAVRPSSKELDEMLKEVDAQK